MRDVDTLDFLDDGLEKDAGIVSSLPGLAYISRRNMLRRISATLGPHASEALKSRPDELRNVHKMLSRIPKGGTLGPVDLSTAAPGFQKYILKSKRLEGELLNRLVTGSRRSPLVAPTQPDTITGIVGKQMRQNPLATLIAGGGLGLAAKKLFAKKDEKAVGTNRSVVIA